MDWRDVCSEEEVQRSFLIKQGNWQILSVPSHEAIMEGLLIDVVTALVGVVCGFMLARALNQPSVPKVKSESQKKAEEEKDKTCRMFYTCDNWMNPACISGDCNMHCNAYCRCGAADNPPKKEVWSEVLEDEK